MTDKLPLESKAALDAPATATTDARRRRLLQASMSAPFVASLQIGTAYAQATASAFQCVAKADGEADSVLGLTDSADSYVRVSIWGFTYSAGSTDKVFWDVTGDDTAPDSGDTLYAEDGTVLSVNNGNGNGKDNNGTTWNYQQDIAAINKMALMLYDPGAPDYLHVSELTDATPIYPKFVIMQNTQIGMPQSCLCSVTGGTASVCQIG